MGISRSIPAGQDDVQRQLADLRRQVKELQGARSLGSSSLGSGSLTVAGGDLVVLDGSGNIVAELSQALPDSLGSGLIVKRSDGTYQFISGNFTGISDRSNTVVVSDDTTGGMGIATPWFHEAGTFIDNLAPTNTTTSASYVTLQTGFVVRAHPKFVFAALVYSSAAATTGNVQLIDGASNVCATVAVPANALTYLTTTAAAWPSWTFLDSQFMSVQAQRTGGAGTIGVRALGIVGVQS